MLQKHQDAFEGEPNWFNYSKFYDLIAQKNFLTFVEVGVFLGRSLGYLTSKIAENKSNNMRDVKIYGIDLFDDYYSNLMLKLLGPNQTVSQKKYEIARNRIDSTGYGDFVSLIKEDSATAAKYFEDGSVDFVFIDANHSAEFVAKDVSSWLPKIKKGGVISGHDYSSSENDTNDVKKVVDLFFGDKLKTHPDAKSCWYVEIL